MLFRSRKQLFCFVLFSSVLVGGGWRAISNASIKVSSWLLKGNVCLVTRLDQTILEAVSSEPSREVFPLLQGLEMVSFSFSPRAVHLIGAVF